MCIFAKENNVLTNKRQTAIPLHPKRWSFLAEILMKKLCTNYCRANGLEFFPNTEYKVEFNPIDKCLIIYNCWGCTIVPTWFINNNFI